MHSYDHLRIMWMQGVHIYIASKKYRNKIVHITRLEAIDVGNKCIIHISKQTTYLLDFVFCLAYLV